MLVNDFVLFKLSVGGKALQHSASFDFTEAEYYCLLLGLY